jgi:pimeloyl-ACP methyl ester carboxylesterase
MLHHTQLLIGTARLEGDLCHVQPGVGLVIFAHGSGSSRNSRRNLQVAQTLQHRGLSTLLFDLLTPTEADNRANVFDIGLLSQRVLEAIDALPADMRGLPLGLFGASTGAAAALAAAAERPREVQAVVSRGGRPDLAREALPRVRAATLLIVGGADTEVLQLNREAYKLLACEKRIDLVPRATHLFQEAGTLETVAELARDWFLAHLRPSSA